MESNVPARLDQGAGDEDDDESDESGESGENESGEQRDPSVAG